MELIPYQKTLPSFDVSTREQKCLTLGKEDLAV